MVFNIWKQNDVLTYNELTTISSDTTFCIKTGNSIFLEVHNQLEETE